jgi:hypothetical protein
MALQLSETVRNAMLDAIEVTVGTAAVLKIYDLTAGAPANCAASITGTVLATLTLPSDWMAGAATGAKAKANTWSGTGAAAGTADFFRLFASDGTTCHGQGTVTATGGGGDLTLDNAVIASSQAITITAFTLTAANA